MPGDAGVQIAENALLGHQHLAGQRFFGPAAGVADRPLAPFVEHNAFERNRGSYAGGGPQVVAAAVPVLTASLRSRVA